MKSSNKIKSVWNAGCLLGESPTWCINTQSLLFVDIIGKKILRWRSEIEKDIFTTPQEPGCIALCDKNGTMLCAMEHELYSVDLTKDNIEYKSHYSFDEPLENRMNEFQNENDSHEQ